MQRTGPNAASVLRIKRAYAFLAQRQQQCEGFTKEDLAAASGWSIGSVVAYLTKKWSRIIKREGHTLRAVGVLDYSEHEFLSLMSQRDEISADPRKPRLAPQVEMLLRKARESALLALQIYNSPTTVFRTEGFSVMMVIAWTALFHAIFEKRGLPYCYLDESTGGPKTIDGETKAWELAECARQFFAGTTSPVGSNLEFFVRLRNKIEHRFVPAIDPTVAGECQSLVLNFDDLLVAEFGTYFAIRETLAVPLQTGHVRTDETVSALKKLQANHFSEVHGFVTDFRARLSPEVLGDQKFRFSVYLIPKPANHPSGDLAVEFVRETPENADRLAHLTRGIVAIRDRPVANAGHMKPSEVVPLVAKGLGKQFNRSHHVRAWQRYKAHRPTKKGECVTSEGCNTQWCLPDPVHNDYVFTREWVEFLLVKLREESEYAAICGHRQPGPPGRISEQSTKGAR